MIASSFSPYTQVVNLLAQRSSVLLAGDVDGSRGYMDFVRSLEQRYGVRIEVTTVTDPDGRTQAVGGTIRGDRPDCRVTFTVDGDETRCALCYS